MHELEYFDEEIWKKLAFDVGHKKRISNMTFFDCFWRNLKQMHEDPKNPFFQKLEEVLALLKDKHYTVNRQWRYNLEEGRWRTLQELIDRREDCKYGDSIITREDEDTKVLDRAKKIELRLKKMRMAKFSKDLFDEIVEDMRNDNRTLIEMMAELDVDEATI
eukprot:CAMPEP_0170560980 /NCGR_PEP_ID=MMETSP0211-20121228/52067_1 /TAXON_ID=311385 /ORGANISM="Pseudokeronopsis sp., Strain OXSARD2" /LENGTH=161 /DNA_ID=CAMNT_0010875907 /DNA_START=44 /DNA_END=529 /DNA_ORIENTATION=+